MVSYQRPLHHAAAAEVLEERPILRSFSCTAFMEQNHDPASVYHCLALLHVDCWSSPVRISQREGP